MPLVDLTTSIMYSNVEAAAVDCSSLLGRVWGSRSRNNVKLKPINFNWALSHGHSQESGRSMAGTVNSAQWFYLC